MGQAKRRQIEIAQLERENERAISTLERAPAPKPRGMIDLNAIPARPRGLTGQDPASRVQAGLPDG
jgi:hypothetical protein